MGHIVQGDIREVAKTLDPQSVNCIITSPPYWGLRDYQTGKWEGGDPECDHIAQVKYRSNETSTLMNDGRKTPGILPHHGHANMGLQYKGICKKCGAQRIDKQLGMEATPEEYVENLVKVFRDLREAMRDDGTLWIVIGDSYASSGNYATSDERDKTRSNRLSGGKLPAAGRAPTPPGLKPKDLVGIPWMVAFALRADGWYLRSDIIWHKCLSGGTKVYAKTQKGEAPMTIKDMTRLDPSTVKLWTGEKWSQVLGWEEVPPNPNRMQESQKRRSHKYLTGENPPINGEIEIHLRSGEKIGCTQDHRFPTKRGLVEAKNLRKGDILKSCKLPEPKAPISPKYIPDDLGWFVGLYLSEGSTSKDTIQISGHTKEIERWERLQKITDSYGGNFRYYETLKGEGANAHIDSRMLSAIIDIYINGKLAKGKHLSSECWRRSNEFLEQILQGYLDGDGHYDTKNDRWRIGFTKNDALAQDIRTLSARLGFSLRLKRANHTLRNRKFPGWRGQIRFNSSDHFNAKSDNEIVSIEASRARKFWDIIIEDEPHLFSLASGILTHNSNPMPESVTDRPTKAHEYVFLLSKSSQYYYDNEAILETPAKATLERDKYTRIGHNKDAFGDKLINHRNHKTSAFGDSTKGVNKRSVWPIPTKSYKEAHFAVFPPALVIPCLLAGCPPGGIVLDPFFGSGTVGQVAIENGRNYIGVELNPEYIKLAKKRIAAAQPPLFVLG